MSVITSQVVGADAVILRFNSMPSGVQAKVAQAVRALTISLQRDVVANKLSGQVLNVRTGTLRRSIDQVVNETSGSVIGKVSTNLKYGRVHEFGFTGTESVREHIREITQAFGKSIPPTEVTVRAHTRQVNLPERSFLRSALRDLEASGRIRATIEQAVGEGIKP